LQRHVLLAGNQYFFYPEFARHLKQERDKFCDDWSRKSCRPLSEVPRLHLFIVIPHPEQGGMVPRTLDMLTELGHSGTMPSQGDLVKKGSISQDYPDAKYAPYTVAVQDGFAGKQNVTLQHKVLDRTSVQQLQDTLGMEVSVARLRTSGLDANRRMAYREI